MNSSKQNYVILKNLHSLGRISAFLAMQEMLQREVIVYQITLFHSDQARLLTICEQELRKWSKLEHPIITRIFDGWTEERKIFFVTTKLEGDSLESILGRGTVPELKQALEIAVATASVLGYLHNNGIYQGGVDLSCFAIEEERWTRMTEKGLIRQLNYKLENAQLEAFENSEDTNKAKLDDISSWGAVFGALLTGNTQFGYKYAAGQKRREFDVENIELRKKHPELPEGIERIILRTVATSMTPKQGYSSFAEILGDLAKISLSQI